MHNHCYYSNSNAQNFSKAKSKVKVIIVKLIPKVRIMWHCIIFRPLIDIPPKDFLVYLFTPYSPFQNYCHILLNRIFYSIGLSLLNKFTSTSIRSALTRRSLLPNRTMQRDEINNLNRIL